MRTVKIFISVAPLLVLAFALAFGGAKRIDDHVGTIAVSSDNYSADTVRATGSLDKIVVVDAARDQKYDELHYTLYISDLSGGDTALGNTDTFVAVGYLGWPYQNIAISYDTCLPPCTINVNYLEDIVDTSGGVVRLSGLVMDNFWFDWTLADSARVGVEADSTSTAGINYKIRLVEYQTE